MNVPRRKIKVPLLILVCAKHLPPQMHHDVHVSSRGVWGYTNTYSAAVGDARVPAQLRQIAQQTISAAFEEMFRVGKAEISKAAKSGMNPVSPNRNDCMIKLHMS